ncbi:MAG: prepilin-type N-terminal cleavage/methylation domain-containing protein [Patescibacteria group bacterium]
MKTGFTLIELIIVIAVIAILATTVILVLNPANILKEARDSQRIADLGQMSSALSLYLATYGSPSLGVAANCYVNPAVAVLNCDGRHVGATTVVASQAVDGTGWVPVNLGNVSGGSPLSVWPVDPTNNITPLFYSYATNGATTYELNASMESDRYSNAGSDDVESTDGGNNANVYEIGNAPGLAL